MKIIKSLTFLLVLAMLCMSISGCGFNDNKKKLSLVEHDKEVSSSGIGKIEEESVAESTFETIASMGIEVITELPTEPSTEAFSTESAYYIGADMDNILSGGYMVEDSQYIYFVDTNKATVWGSDEVQKSGHICKYDKANKVCEDLTSASWSEVFFSPLNNDPLKSLNISQDGYLYALAYNSDICGHSIVRIQTETGDIAPFYVPEYSIDSMILVQNYLIYTTTAGGVYSLSTVSGENTTLADSETDSTDESWYGNYTIIGILGNSLYYAYNIVTGESADDYFMKMELTQYSLDTGEKKIIEIKDESGADCSKYFDSEQLCLMGNSILSLRSHNTYLFRLDTQTAEKIGDLYEKLGVSDGWYSSGKIHLGNAMYFYNADSEMTIVRLSDGLSDGGVFYTADFMYAGSNDDLNLLSMYSFGKADEKLVLAAQERVLFISEDGTEEILEFDD